MTFSANFSTTIYPKSSNCILFQLFVLQSDYIGINIKFLVSKSWENSKIAQSAIFVRGYPQQKSKIGHNLLYKLDIFIVLGSIPPFATKPELIMTSEHKFINHLACKLPIYNFSCVFWFCIAVFWAKKGPKSKFLAYVGQISICQVILHGIMHILGLSCFWQKNCEDPSAALN